MRRRWWILFVCFICLALVVPLAVSAQDEPEPVPFTQLFTEDGLISLAFPTAWQVISDTGFTDTLVFASDPDQIAGMTTAEEWNASDSAIVQISLISAAAAADLGYTGATTAENAALLRNAAAAATGADGQPTVVGDLQSAPGLRADSEIFSFTTQEQDLFTVTLFWEPVEGLLAQANVITPEANWDALQPIVLDMARSVLFLGEPEQLQAEGSN